MTETNQSTWWENATLGGALLKLFAFGILGFSCYATRHFVLESLDGKIESGMTGVLAWIAVLFTASGAILSMNWNKHKNLLLMAGVLCMTGVFNGGFAYQVFFSDGGQGALAEGQAATYRDLLQSLEQQRTVVAAQWDAELNDGIGDRSRANFADLQALDSQIRDYQIKLADAEITLAGGEASSSMIKALITEMVPPEYQLYVLAAFLILFCLMLDPFVYACLGVANRMDRRKSEPVPVATQPRRSRSGKKRGRPSTIAKGLQELIDAAPDSPDADRARDFLDDLQSE